MKGPPEYSKKVDMQKVNLEVMKQYVKAPSYPQIRYYSSSPFYLVRHPPIPVWLGEEVTESHWLGFQMDL